MQTAAGEEEGAGKALSNPIRLQQRLDAHTLMMLFVKGGQTLPGARTLLVMLAAAMTPSGCSLRG